MRKLGRVGLVVLVALTLGAGVLHAQSDITVRTPALRGLSKVPTAVPSLPVASVGTTTTAQAPGQGGADLMGLPQFSVPGAITTDQAQAMSLAPNGEFSQALRIVAHFLMLREDQVQALAELLQMRRQAVLPLLRQISEKERQLKALIESGGDPASIGQLVLEIHEYYKLIVRIQTDFIASLHDLLDPEQKDKLNLIRIALHLQPILPAFKALHII
ncbi:MAG: hypothetical protein ACE5HB_04275 [Terriglobia bacterium]